MSCAFPDDSVPPGTEGTGATCRRDPRGGHGRRRASSRFLRGAHELVPEAGVATGHLSEFSSSPRVSEADGTGSASSWKDLGVIPPKMSPANLVLTHGCQTKTGVFLAQKRVGAEMHYSAGHDLFRTKGSGPRRSTLHRPRTRTRRRAQAIANGSAPRGCLPCCSNIAACSRHIPYSSTTEFALESDGTMADGKPLARMSCRQPRTPAAISIPGHTRKRSAHLHVAAHVIYSAKAVGNIVRVSLG